MPTVSCCHGQVNDAYMGKHNCSSIRVCRCRCAGGGVCLSAQGHVSLTSVQRMSLIAQLLGCCPDSQVYMQVCTFGDAHALQNNKLLCVGWLFLRAYMHRTQTGRHNIQLPPCCASSLCGRTGILLKAACGYVEVECKDTPTCRIAAYGKLCGWASLNCTAQV